MPLRTRFGPAEDDHAAPSFTELTIAARGLGLRPFAPVHLRAMRERGSGDIQLHWVRRTRWGGDSWTAVETPLNEASEAYRLEIYQGGVRRRRVELTSAAFRYHAALQLGDLGGLLPFTVRIAQMSATAGPGALLTEIVDV